MRVIPLTLRRARTLRREMTPPEVKLWSILRGDTMHGLRFRRQHAMGPYILDFYCSRAALAVEVDGAGHAEETQAAHDARRDRWLAREGVAVLRFPASAVMGDVEIVLATIAEAVRARLATE